MNRQPCCTVCGAQFQPLPDLAHPERTPRESLVCPHCGSTSRRRAVALAVLQAIGARRNGCRALAHLPPSPALRSWEVGWSSISRALQRAFGHTVSEIEARGEAEAQNLEHLTWAGPRFDLIICSDVLEHVRRYRRALSEMARVLRPGGTLILTAPEAPARRHELYCYIFDEANPGTDVWAENPPRHEDPCDPAGCLVYRLYNYECLRQEMEEFGLIASQSAADCPDFAIVDCAVLCGAKPANGA